MTVYGERIQAGKGLVRRAAALLLAAGAACAQETRAPVIVELFTSEGCSSCPAADELLARLDRTQPVAGARVIALEEHVDYWNSLGWTDPFSSPQFRFRQNDYARRSRSDNVYTPQMVVAGQAAFVGDDAPRAYQEIQGASARQTAAIRLKLSPAAQEPDAFDLRVYVKEAAAEAADVYLAVTESRLASNVASGENSGRSLRHAPVVRSFGVIGKLDAAKGGLAQLTPTLRFPKTWKRENLRAVVFVEERATHKIAGAAAIEVAGAH